MSRRTERVAELIRREVSRMIVTELTDPRIGFVTVTRVEVSPDLTLAKIFISVLADEGKAQATLRGLNSAKKRIRLEIGDILEVRSTPEIAFVLDTGLKRGLKMSEMLSDLARERAQREGPHPEADDSEEDEEE